MKRVPYQDPQTSMERHVATLVAHLRDGTDNRAGFVQKIEESQAHAFWLENYCTELREENSRLEKAMMPALPPVKCWGEEFDGRDPYYVSTRGTMSFDWGMEQIRWRAAWNGFDEKDPGVARRVKRRAYREILRVFRNEFEKLGRSIWRVIKSIAPMQRGRGRRGDEDAQETGPSWRGVGTA